MKVIHTKTDREIFPPGQFESRGISIQVGKLPITIAYVVGFSGNEATLDAAAALIADALNAFLARDGGKK